VELGERAQWYRSPQETERGQTSRQVREAWRGKWSRQADGTWQVGRSLGSAVFAGAMA